MSARSSHCQSLLGAIVAVSVVSSIAYGQNESKPKVLDTLAEGEHLAFLRHVPEIGLSQANAKSMYGLVVNTRSKAYFPNISPDIGPRIYAAQAEKQKRPDFFAINWRRGDDCQLNPDLAAKLGKRSTALRGHLRDSTTKEGLSADKLRENLKKTKGGADAIDWTDPSSVPALTQMLQPEAEPTRETLVDLLAAIPGKDASIALARRALFDLSASVRQRAVAALKERPAPEYQATLLEGFCWPWPAVAEHAAEAIAGLKLASAAQELTALKDSPDPRVLFEQDRRLYTNEIVKINHLSNCILCHAPSHAAKDPVRGKIPQPGDPLPALYYEDPSGIFVRADTTYLRQDFSVVQPAANPGKWPDNQRYDYFLRTRVASATEVAEFKQSLEKREPPDDRRVNAISFALREIGVDAEAPNERPREPAVARKALPGKR